MCYFLHSPDKGSVWISVKEFSNCMSNCCFEERWHCFVPLKLNMPKVGDGVLFSLHFVSSCFHLEAAAHYCSGAKAQGPCSEVFSSATVAAASVCQTAPAGNRLHRPWAVAIAERKIREEKTANSEDTMIAHFFNTFCITPYRNYDFIRMFCDYYLD